MAKFRCYLLERDTGETWELGIHEADDEHRAKERAKTQFKKLIERLQTGRIVLEAAPYYGPKNAPDRPKQPRPQTGSLL